MTNISNNQYSLKRYTRLVLVIFVLSVINMSMQIPAHASMQMDMQGMDMQGMDMSNGMMDYSKMADMAMEICECPPAVCDAVDAQQDQLNPGASSAIQFDFINFYPTQVQVQEDQLHLSSGQLYQHFDWQYRKISPSPLSVTSTLQI